MAIEVEVVLVRVRGVVAVSLIGLGVAARAAPAQVQTDAPVPAQASPQPAPLPVEESAADIVVRGHRVLGSAIGTIEPVAVLDADALRALGATSTRELLTRLRGIAASPGGGDPALLLNGRRVSGYEELYSLPFEAIERTEILSEQDAARLGFPPTIRVMNFITKKRFRALQALQTAGLATDGRGFTDFAEIGATRIDAGRRLSLTSSYTHQDRLLQSDRAIRPDPSVPFAIEGNVVGVGGGSIDPALDAIAGRAVAIAAVPGDPAARRDLGAYAAGTGAVSDIGPYRSLQPALDRLRFDGTLAMPIGSVDASLNLSAQREWTAGLNGLATAALAVPAGSPALPFATPVVVDRYLPGIVLRQHGDATTLHGGLTVQGGVGGWTWSIVNRYDRAENDGASDIGVPLDALQAAVSAGGDPLQPLGADAARRRLVQRSRSVTDTIGSRGVVTGPLVRLPAGNALVTLTSDYSRSTSDVGSAVDGGSGGGGGSRNVGRSIANASAAIDLPIASASRGVLSAVGQLGVNALVGVTSVSGYGRLTNTNIAVNWAPVAPVQLIGSINRTRTAPAINQLVDPVLVIPNVPVFDYLTGQTVLVTTLAGGNPALGPERRRVTTLGLQLHPFKGDALRLTVNLVDTLIGGQAASLGNVTAAFQAAFPSLFARSATGELSRVDLRPVNLARERERKLYVSLGGHAALGHAPPPPPPPAPGKPPPAPPKPRVNLYAFLSGNYRFHDRLELRDGLAPLDLLDGASLTGSGGRPRWDVDGTIGGNYGPLSTGLYNQFQGPTRIRSDLPNADLSFSARTVMSFYTDLDLGAVVKRPWAKRLSVNVVVDNLLNNRIAVRDRDGETPNRFQSAYLDPVGRSIRLAIRKLF